MRSSNLLFAVLLFLSCGHYVQAQEKIDVKPYTAETAFQKIKKNHPFVKPIEPLRSQEINVRENVVYRKVGERELKADIYSPVNEGSTVLPAVLLIHGGGWATGSKENLRIMAQHLADNGFVAITAEYRLSGEAPYPAAIHDLKAALGWMRNNAESYSIDPDKIAVLGTSAGAQIATLLGVTPDSPLYKREEQIADEVQAIVNIDGIVSFIHPEAEESGMAGQWLGGLQEENPENWKEASPLEYVDQKTPPILFINSSQARFHAGRDDMVEIMDRYGIYNEVHTFVESPHSFWHVAPWFTPTLNHTVQFLNKIFSDEYVPYKTITVAKDGTGEFETIQEAVNSVRDLGPGEVLINIKSGIYREKLVIPSWKHKLSLVGENRENTIIINDDYSGKVNPSTKEVINTFTSHTVLVEGNDIILENLTIQNTWCDEGQAVALHVEGDRFVIKDSNILGCQDTVYTATEGSRQLYLNCYIEGTTDFIFGEATAVFKNCTIKSLKNSFITAAATPQNQEFGYVFIDCKLIAAPGVTEVYLGRPWRPFSKTVFINSHLGEHILPVGWDPWPGDKMFPNKERTAYYAEYKNTGPGASPLTRAEWSHQLEAQEVEKYHIKNIFGTSGDWYWAAKAMNNNKTSDEKN